MESSKLVILICVLAVQLVASQDENVTESTLTFQIQRGKKQPIFYIQRYGCDECETLIVNVASLEETNTKKELNWQFNKGLKVSKNTIILEKTDGNFSKVEQILYSCDDCDFDSENNDRSVFHGDVQILLFQEGGEYKIKDQAIWVQEGSFKINLNIQDWQFDNKENEIIWRIDFKEYYQWGNYSNGGDIWNYTEGNSSQSSGDPGQVRFLQKNQSSSGDETSMPPTQYDNNTKPQDPNYNYTQYDGDEYLPTDYQNYLQLYYGDFLVNFPFIGLKYQEKNYEKTDIKVTQGNDGQVEVRIPNFGEDSVFYDPSISQSYFYDMAYGNKNSDSEDQQKPKNDSSSLLQALLAFVLLLL